jgi:hypothetical protein
MATGEGQGQTLLGYILRYASIPVSYISGALSPSQLPASAVQYDTEDHVILTGGVPTTDSGTVQAGSTDNAGVVTGLTAATELTVTFAHPFPGPRWPACALTEYPSTLIATASSWQVTALNGVALGTPPVAPFVSVTFSINTGTFTGALGWNCL